MAASLALPVPALAALNSLSAQYPLDRLHYLLLQLVLLLLVPATATAAKWLERGESRHACVAQAPAATQAPVETQAESAAHASAAGAHTAAAGAHRYTAQCAELERRFLQLTASSDGDKADGTWTALATVREPYPVTVEGHAEKPFCFRVTFYAPTGPGTAFDLLSDVLRRPEWDELTEATRVVERLSATDALHYVKMRAVWPTAARDSLLLSHLARARTADGRPALLNVSQSAVDPRVPENTAAGIVRMEAGIAGQLVAAAPPDDLRRLGLPAAGPWCKVVQIADGDLKGWIPKSVVKFIATQALPRSLAKVCRQMADLPPAADSKLLADSNAPSPGSAHVLPAAQREPLPLPPPPPPPAVAAAAAAAAAGPVPAAGAPRRALISRAGWLRIAMRYAAPALIAAATSLLFHILAGRRGRWLRRRH
ncbi:hypothetical protein H4R18_001379 [Coemansia javaensis]|uniref:START domain-containing protein n=1 Tax=Coemansia javaensis TaxID=2761396 RepID=A0A9W8HKS5_9FUNG|nr:hypothetical protein H4R18_001379 [Coemansia javaensis]